MSDPDCEADSTPFLRTVEHGEAEDAARGFLGIWTRTKPLGYHVLQVIGSALFGVSIGVILILQIADILAGSTDAFPAKKYDYILDSTWQFNAPPQRREYYWTISDASHRVGDTVHEMILINRQFPGPLIEVNDGDTLVVHVDNQASNSTSIHWHGIYQKGSNWFDGTVGITQCPIAPGSKFTYEFKIDGQAGTYWYHAHLAVQTADGLYGPLIIHSKDEYALQRMPYTSDRIVMVQDFYTNLSAQLLSQYLEPDNENAEPIPNGALLNGRNFQDCLGPSNQPCTDQNPTFELAKGENHRLRFINVGVFATFNIQIDKHALAITEVDGTDVLPAPIDSVVINPGQRYSVILSANQTEGESFWLRAAMNTNCFASRVRGLNSEARGVIQYYQSFTKSPSPQHDNIQSSSSSPPPPPECGDMPLELFHPVNPVTAPAKPDMSFYIRTSFEIGAHRLSRGFFNSSSLRLDVRSPALHRLISGIEVSNASFNVLEPPPLIVPSIFGPQPFPELKDGIGVNTKAYDPSKELVLQTPDTHKVVDLVFVNFDDGSHPLHLHGHKFFVLGQGKGYPPASVLNLATEEAKDEALELDLSTPLRRDTAMVQSFGWIHLRVALDNAGMWLLHCHNAWHAEAGMGMVMAVGVDEIAEQVHSHTAGWVDAIGQQSSMCTMDGIERGQRPADSVWNNA